MRKIIVTEENFNNVLERLQKVCNKYKMFEFYRVFTENMEEQKQYRSNAIGFRDSVKSHTDKNGNWTYKKVKEFFSYNKYVRVTKHHFREEFEQGKDKYNYPKMKSLIHMDLSGCSALVISEGDRVQCLPFGGFVVWTDDDFTRFENPLTIYKHIYIPDYFKGKIINLEEENTTRDKEWEEEAAWWHEQYEKDMEREMMEDYKW